MKKVSLIWMYAYVLLVHWRLYGCFRSERLSEVNVFHIKTTMVCLEKRGSLNYIIL